MIKVEDQRAMRRRFRKLSAQKLAAQVALGRILVGSDSLAYGTVTPNGVEVLVALLLLPA